MAVYFHGNPEIQVPDGLQTLVLMNPNYVQYSDTPTPQTNNLVFLNSSSTSAHALHSPHSQQLVGIPLSAAATPASQDSLHGLVQRVHYNLYNPIDPSAGARETPRAQQGLSLSLSSQQQPSNYGPAAAEDIRVAAGWASSGSGVTNGASGMHGVLLSSKYLKAAQELLDEVVNVNNSSTGIDKGPELVRKGSGNNSSSSKVMGESSGGAVDGGAAAGKRSVELSTAERQEIQMKKAKLINMLDEVEQRYKQYHQQMQMVISTFEHAAGIGTARTYTALALKTISRQFRCLKDAITGQIRASSRSLGEEDTLGGKIEGSRLKFVDNHFRQQRALQQLGMIQHNAWRPQRGLPERSVSVLRAWLFEHFLHPYPKDSDKQMLAKQTGLTRSQVSNWFINARVRLWKPMVEEMYLEEIKEQEQSGALISDDKTSKSPKNEDAISSKATSFSPTPETKAKQNMMNHMNAAGGAAAAAISISTASTTPSIAGNQSGGFSLIDMEGMTTASPKRLRTSNDMLQSPGASMSSINMEMKQSEQRVGRDGYSFMGSHTNLMGSFGQYQMAAAADMAAGRFDETEHHHHQQQFTPRFSGNGVSLTLGLPHCDNLSLSGAHHHHHHHHQGFLQNPNVQMGRQMSHEFGAMNSSTPHHSGTAAFEIQNGKRFAAQLLHDFVA